MNRQKLWKRSLIGCGTVILLIAVAAIWLAMQIFSTPANVEMKE